MAESARQAGRQTLQALQKLGRAGQQLGRDILDSPAKLLAKAKRSRRKTSSSRIAASPDGDTINGDRPRRDDSEEKENGSFSPLSSSSPPAPVDDTDPSTSSTVDDSTSFNDHSDSQSSPPRRRLMLDSNLDSTEGSSNRSGEPEIQSLPSPFTPRGKGLTSPRSKMVTEVLGPEYRPETKWLLEGIKALNDGDVRFYLGLLRASSSADHPLASALPRFEPSSYALPTGPPYAMDVLFGSIVGHAARADLEAQWKRKWANEQLAKKTGVAVEVVDLVAESQTDETSLSSNTDGTGGGAAGQVTLFLPSPQSERAWSILQALVTVAEEAASVSLGEGQGEKEQEQEDGWALLLRISELPYPYDRSLLPSGSESRRPSPSPFVRTTLDWNRRTEVLREFGAVLDVERAAEEEMRRSAEGRVKEAEKRRKRQRRKAGDSDGSSSSSSSSSEGEDNSANGADDDAVFSPDDHASRRALARLKKTVDANGAAIESPAPSGPKAKGKAKFAQPDASSSSSASFSATVAGSADADADAPPPLPQPPTLRCFLHPPFSPFDLQSQERYLQHTYLALAEKRTLFLTLLTQSVSTAKVRRAKANAVSARRQSELSARASKIALDLGRFTNAAQAAEEAATNALAEARRDDLRAQALSQEARMAGRELRKAVLEPAVRLKGEKVVKAENAQAAAEFEAARGRLRAAREAGVRAHERLEAARGQLHAANAKYDRVALALEGFDAKAKKERTTHASLKQLTEQLEAALRAEKKRHASTLEAVTAARAETARETLVELEVGARGVQLIFATASVVGGWSSLFLKIFRCMTAAPDPTETNPEVVWDPEPAYVSELFSPGRGRTQEQVKSPTWRTVTIDLWKLCRAEHGRYFKIEVWDCDASVQHIQSVVNSALEQAAAQAAAKAQEEAAAASRGQTDTDTDPSQLLPDGTLAQPPPSSSQPGEVASVTLPTTAAIKYQHIGQCVCTLAQLLAARDRRQYVADPTSSNGIWTAPILNSAAFGASTPSKPYADSGTLIVHAVRVVERKAAT